MTWTLTTLVPADRDLVVNTLRAEAERRDKAASQSALTLVTSTDDGRISAKSAKAVRQLHVDAETLRSLAWELEHQPEVTTVVEASDVADEERAATYPPLEAVTPMVETLNTIETPRRTKSTRRGVKVVEFRPEDDERAAAMAAHPSNQTPNQEDQP